MINIKVKKYDVRGSAYNSDASIAVEISFSNKKDKTEVEQLVKYFSNLSIWFEGSDDTDTDKGLVVLWQGENDSL